MNVGELKKLLAKYPDSLELIHSRYSDYEIFNAKEIKLVEGVDNDGWVMRAHETMSAENKAKSQFFLLLLESSD